MRTARLVAATLLEAAIAARRPARWTAWIVLLAWTAWRVAGPVVARLTWT